MGLGLTDGKGAEMKDRGGQNRAGMAFSDPLDEVIERAERVGDDMLELNLSISGRNIAEYTQRQLRQNNPTQKDQYEIVSVTKSEMNAQGYEGLVRYLDELILSINFEQVG